MRRLAAVRAQLWLQRTTQLFFVAVRSHRRCSLSDFQTSLHKLLLDLYDWSKINFLSNKYFFKAELFWTNFELYPGSGQSFAPLSPAELVRLGVLKVQLATLGTLAEELLSPAEQVFQKIFIIPNTSTASLTTYFSLVVRSCARDHEIEMSGAEDV